MTSQTTEITEAQEQASTTAPPEQSLETEGELHRSVLVEAKPTERDIPSQPEDDSKILDALKSNIGKDPSLEELVQNLRDHYGPGELTDNEVLEISMHINHIVDGYHRFSFSPDFDWRLLVNPALGLALDNHEHSQRREAVADVYRALLREGHLDQDDSAETAGTRILEHLAEAEEATQVIRRSAAGGRAASVSQSQLDDERDNQVTDVADDAIRDDQISPEREVEQRLAIMPLTSPPSHEQDPTPDNSGLSDFDQRLQAEVKNGARINDLQYLVGALELHLANGEEVIDEHMREVLAAASENAPITALPPTPDEIRSQATINMVQDIREQLHQLGLLPEDGSPGLLTSYIASMISNPGFDELGRVK